MSLVAIIPVAKLGAANTTLEAAGFGPRNFSVAAYKIGVATHAALHAWDDAAFTSAVKAIAGVVTDELAGDPVTRTKALIEAQGAKWGDQLPTLPATGNVANNSMWRWNDDILIVIQAFNRTTYPNDPYTYPALIARVHVPGERREWKQPQYAFDAYKLVNPFNGLPDECTHGGKAWRVLQGDGAGNNVWTPGVFGWDVVPPESLPGEPGWKDIGVTVTQIGGANLLYVTSTAQFIVGSLVRCRGIEATVTSIFTPGTPGLLIINPDIRAQAGDTVELWV